jgi:hypothetical protein
VAQLLRVAADGLLHPQRCITSAHRVILMGERRPEQRHDAVAHYLIHGSLVVMDSFHHPIEDWRENFARFLGIAVGKQFHRTLQIGKEHCYLFTLAFERGSRNQNSFGEMRRQVILWSGETRLSGGR